MIAAPHQQGSGEEWISTADVARRLGVQTSTVYAYVSRGILPAERVGRNSRFKLSDVQTLAEQRNPGGWREVGSDSKIFNLIEGQISYRGQDVLDHIEIWNFGDAVRVLWDVPPSRDGEFWSTPDGEIIEVAVACIGHLPQESLVSDQLKVAVAILTALDQPGPSYHVPEVIESGKRLLVAMVRALRQVSGQPADSTFAACLWSRLSPLLAGPDEVALLDAALVLVADHGMAGSTRVTRTAASLGATIGGVLGAGMDAGTNDIRGSSALIVEDMVRSIEISRQPLRGIVELARVQRRLPGFGHESHPQGDVRARYLLDRLGRVTRKGPRYRDVESLAQAMVQRGLPPPNIYFALASIAYCFDMERGATEAMFSVGRSAGWIAHALEEYSRFGPSEAVPDSEAFAHS